ncbi:MAG: cell division protein ZapA [Deltaproteobacteria bacterium]|nr:cell division protein ZapA [Deltaproteobacteria bacterium]
MASIEISIGGQKYMLCSEESEEHLREVADMVKRKVEKLRAEKPNLSQQKATMLAAFDFASGFIKGSQKALTYKNSILTKAQDLLQRVENQMGSHTKCQP